MIIYFELYVQFIKKSIHSILNYFLTNVILHDNINVSKDRI